MGSITTRWCGLQVLASRCEIMHILVRGDLLCALRTHMYIPLLIDTYWCTLVCAYVLVSILVHMSTLRCDLRHKDDTTTRDVSVIFLSFSVVTVLLVVS